MVYSKCKCNENLVEALAFSKGWDDALLCSGYFALISQIWKKSTEVGDYEEFSRFIREIPSGLLRNEASFLNFCGEGDLKNRGKFGIVAFHLICISILGIESEAQIGNWLNLLENMVKTVLFIAESNKKTLVREESKLYSLCIAYAIGFLSYIMPKHHCRSHIQHSLAKIIKYTFTTFSLNSTKTQFSGLKSILKMNLTQYNYPCDYIVIFILNYNSSIEA